MPAAFKSNKVGFLQAPCHIIKPDETGAKAVIDVKDLKRDFTKFTTIIVGVRAMTGAPVEFELPNATYVRTW